MIPYPAFVPASPGDGPGASGTPALWSLLVVLAGGPVTAIVAPQTAPWLPWNLPLAAVALALIAGAAVAGARRSPVAVWHSGVMPPLVALGVQTALAAVLRPDTRPGAITELGWISAALLGARVAAIPGSAILTAGAAAAMTGGWLAVRAALGARGVDGMTAILPAAVAAPLAVAVAGSVRGWARRVAWLALAAALAVVALREARALVHPMSTVTQRPLPPDRDRLGDAAGRRLFLGWQALLLWRDRPLVGTGPGGFRRAHPAVQARLLALDRKGEWRDLAVRSATPGGDALRLIAELGLAGAGAAAWLVWALARSALDRWRRARGSERIAAGFLSVAGLVWLAGAAVWSPLTAPVTVVLGAAILTALASGAGAVRPVPVPWPRRTGWRIAASVAVLAAAARAGLEVARPALAARDTTRGLAALSGPAADPATALRHLDRATTRDPAAGEAWLARGTAEAALGRYDDAAAYIQRAAALLGDERAPLAAGLAALEAGDPVAARRKLGEALWLRPGWSAALGALGALEWRAGRRAAAVARLREAVRADASHLAARRLLGLLRWHDRDLREALELLLPVYAADPADPHVAGILDRIRERRFAGGRS